MQRFKRGELPWSVYRGGQWRSALTENARPYGEAPCAAWCVASSQWQKRKGDDERARAGYPTSLP